MSVQSPFLRLREMWRLALILLMFLGTGAVLRSYELGVATSPRVDFSSFPPVVREWAGEDVSITASMRDSFKAGSFLFRTYRNPTISTEVSLFLVYFPSQKIGETIHSPKNCLPGSGWVPVQSGQIRISPGQLDQFEVNRYVFARGTERQLVLYWYEAHGRSLASEYKVKYRLVLDSLSMGRSDGALIRVSTPIKNTETDEQAQARLLRFLGELLPVSRRYIPQ